LQHILARQYESEKKEGEASLFLRVSATSVSWFLAITLFPIS